MWGVHVMVHGQCRSPGPRDLATSDLAAVRRRSCLSGSSRWPLLTMDVQDKSVSCQALAVVRLRFGSVQERAVLSLRAWACVRYVRRARRARPRRRRPRRLWCRSFDERGWAYGPSLRTFVEASQGRRSLPVCSTVWYVGKARPVAGLDGLVRRQAVGECSRRGRRAGLPGHP